MTRAHRRALNVTPKQIEALKLNCEWTARVYNQGLFEYKKNYENKVGYTKCEVTDLKTKKKYFKRYLTKEEVEFQGGKVPVKDIPVGTEFTLKYKSGPQLVKLLFYKSPVEVEKINSGTLYTKLIKAGSQWVQSFSPEEKEAFDSVNAIVKVAALKNVETAFKNFFAGLKVGQVKYPQRKRVHLHRSFYIHNQVVGTSSGKFKDSKHLKLGSGVLSSVKLFEKLELDPKIKIESGSVVFDGRHWNVNLVCTNDAKRMATPENPRVLGIDLNLTQDTAIALSSGAMIPTIKPFKKYEFKLAKLQRKLEKCKKGGQNQKKLLLKVVSLHSKIKAIRGDSTHKASRQIANMTDVLVTDPIGIKNLMKTKMGKSFADAGHGELRRQLEYKVNEVHVGREKFFPSSKTCCECRERLSDANGEELTLADRYVTCKNAECRNYHIEILRDLNAAINHERQYWRGETVNLSQIGDEKANVAKLKKEKGQQTRKDNITAKALAKVTVTA